LLVTGAARDMIRERDRTPSLHDYIKESREQYGMQTFDQHLTDLLQEGVVTFDTAMAAATNPSDFELKMRMFRRVATTVTQSEVAANGDAGAIETPDTPDAGMDGISPGAGAFDFLNS
jgi:twitching motility protein PilT